MDTAIELLFRSFTRYFIPGLVFVFAALLLPIALADPEAVVSTFSKSSLGAALLLSIVCGYLLDSVGAYRWTLLYHRYRQVRGNFNLELNELTGANVSDPDQHLAELWFEKPQSYERVFLDRAEWVLILESSFALWIAAVIILFLVLFLQNYSLSSVLLHAVAAILLLVLSYFSADKGIQRMRAHNVKIIVALKHLLGKTA